MSILFVLLMFLLIMTISYFLQPQEQPTVKPEIWAKPQPPRMQRELGLEIPQGYCFHPGHTWVLKETAENARVGVDGFATNLVGKIDHIDVIGPNRWVRQPLPQELAECSTFLDREIAGLENVKVVVALGKIGFDAYLNYLKRRGLLPSRKPYLFKHGAHYQMPDGNVLLASYHPSNQNTATGKLTREMFVKIFKQAAKLADR